MKHDIRTLRRSLGAFLNISVNRIFGRTCVPHPRKQIFIETSGRCNLACRFCAYPKKEEPGAFMPADRFRKIVEEAVALGYDTVILTPMLGEVFADPTIREKLQFLESHGGIRSYLFYSNFILPDEATVRSLGDLRKLTEIHISVYGLDRDSFTAVTRKPASQYERLLRNLRALSTMDDIAGRMLSFSIRSGGGITDDTLPDTEVTRLLFAMRDRLGAVIDVADSYDTWGGKITEEDVAPIGVRLTDGAHIYKYGACAMIFGAVQIKADGAVHACACRDVDGSLLLGHLDRTPLSSVVSTANPTYAALIDDQQHGDFLPNCRACSAYTSIYDTRRNKFPERTPNIALDKALAMLDEKDRTAHSEPGRNRAPP